MGSQSAWRYVIAAALGACKRAFLKGGGGRGNELEGKRNIDK
jgi:hypothetical protein